MLPSAITFARGTTVFAQQDEWMGWARAAWRYFQPGTGVNATNGLHYGALDWHYTTDWDVGTYITAILSAESIGILSREGEWGSNYRLERVLHFLETRSLRPDDDLPYWAYRSDNNASPALDLDRKVTDWNDAGKLMVALALLRSYRPDMGTRINLLVDRMRPAYAKNFVRNERVVGIGGFYGYYASFGYAAFGFDVSKTVSEMDKLSAGPHIQVYSQMLPVSDITSEPIVMGMMELRGNVSEVFKQYAYRLYQVQEDRYSSTGFLTAWSEGATDVEPYFCYEWIMRKTNEESPQLWKIKGPAASDIASDKFPIVYTKIAFAFNAIYPSEYTRLLVSRILPSTLTSLGFREGIREKTSQPIGSTTSPVTDKTNAFVIEAAMYALGITIPEFPYAFAILGVCLTILAGVVWSIAGRNSRKQLTLQPRRFGDCAD